jgi:sec-independent protein translocase protein TatA
MPLPNIGPGELILILIIALIILGPGRLPDVAASLGKSLREFRRAATDVSDAAKLDTASPQATTASPPTASAPSAPLGAPVGAPSTTSTPADSTPPDEPARPSDASPRPAGEPARDPNAG